MSITRKKWFAWRPVKDGYGRGIIWLEWCERDTLHYTRPFWPYFARVHSYWRM